MFCWACAAELPELPPVVCSSCGTEHWRNAKPCAGALVAHERRVLLVRRAVEPWARHWDIPGGFCEPDEHPVDAARREVREETGLEIEVGGLLGMWMDRYGVAEAGAPPTATLNIYFHAAPTRGVEVTIDPAEVDEVGWFSADDLPPEVAFPHHSRAVLAAWAGSPAARP